jgi:NAD(P)H dehydrogenase (quinone)
MTTYAITSVTGRFGRVAVKELAQLVPATDIVALARNTDKAAALVPAGVTVRAGDYTQPAELVQSLQGVDKLLFVSSIPSRVMPRPQQHQNVIDAAKQAGVSFIAYTSFPTLIRPPCRWPGITSSLNRRFKPLGWPTPFCAITGI